VGLDELGVAAQIGEQEAAGVWGLGLGDRIFPASVPALLAIGPIMEGTVKQRPPMSARVGSTRTSGITEAQTDAPALAGRRIAQGAARSTSGR
jgi:hypothetical protein